MLTKSSLIFIVDDNLYYGKMILYHLKNQGFENVILFSDENKCLDNFKKKPRLLISDYHLKEMNGLQLIQKARGVYQGFYTILLSGSYYEEDFNNNVILHEIDKYIIKGQDELQILADTLNDWINSG
jgi:DNA-binding response OmpR family regulator